MCSYRVNQTITITEFLAISVMSNVTSTDINCNNFLNALKLWNSTFYISYNPFWNHLICTTHHCHRDFYNGKFTIWTFTQSYYVAYMAQYVNMILLATQTADFSQGDIFVSKLMKKGNWQTAQTCVLEWNTTTAIQFHVTNNQFVLIKFLNHNIVKVVKSTNGELNIM